MKILSIIIFNLMLIFNLNAQTEQFDELFNAYSDGKCPGASVLVSMNGKIVFNKFYGYSNLEEGTMAKINTNYRLASLTKQFTAASILILIQKGLINIDSKLSDIFSDFPECGNKITIKNLLTHTSGLIDYEDLIPDTATTQAKDADVLKMMYKLDSTYFEPGTQYKYSNTGFALLALIVEKISKRSFPQFLKENTFKLLQMKNTVAHEEGISIVIDRAYGYERTDSGWIRHDQSITSAVLGDGGIYSSIEDLYKWDQSLYTNKILSDELRKESMTRAVLNNGEKIDYGYGWHLKTYNGEEIIYHGGSTQGFRNVIYRVPSKEFTIIILTNRNEGEPEKIADKIFEIYFVK